MLTDADARLCRLFSSIILGKWDDVMALRRSVSPPEPDRRWRECVLMVHLFGGVPRMIEAFDHLEAAGGLGEPTEEELREEGDLQARGRQMFETIYGNRARAVREHLHRHHPALGDWVASHAYGRVLSRPGLDAATRELLAVAALASLGQERQLASHARGAVRCGADPDAVEAVLDLLPA
ncbi:MAG: carboxymuconolactone decarboxylase family protein, partial [Myxococcota bacterium]